ncbi:MAG TPA: alpha-1,4-glucan--maltose-1-phosphate maltosyltransferase [Rhodanobacteraceae bacterium]|nr:alpha-1,4-glucan--maltose-1-phosphate maltosyltransferase [Rhodanobacteraceae bacterium]
MVAAAHHASTDEETGPRRPQALGANRVVIESVWPQIDEGRHPVKRVVGDVLEVWADIFCDGHDALDACVRYRDVRARKWHTAPMALVDNDRWRGEFRLESNTRYRYFIEAWRDLFATWREDLLKKRDAGQDTALELREGIALVRRAARRRPKPLAERLHALEAERDSESLQAALLDPGLLDLMRQCGGRENLARYRPTLEVIVDRPQARFGAWYELFPRSASNDAQRHGTFGDVIARLPYVRDLGFDVLYLPPIHPIGVQHRKGRNNALHAGPDDPGSPWAIGSPEGGHTAIHPQLGTLADFRRLVDAARDHGIEVALDLAVQCSRDHPWIREHPEWFDWRPDGTIRYAENPPKKYEDIVNVHFYRDARPSLWLALLDVVLFWLGQGVRIFRVDNPHTKPVPFWQWLIREVQDHDPGVVFLAEAFTRPKLMKELAKIGFTQSYTYFTWRNTKAELTEYLTELTEDVPKEYMRPNFFVNTPDINPVILQTGGRPAFRIRAALAATLSSLWGIYSGYEICESEPIPGREEYLDSEKYQLKARDFDAPGNIRQDIARLNRIRRENPALQQLTNLRFHPAHDDNMLFYGKMTANRDNVIWMAVNLDPHHAHEADLELPLYTLGLPDHASVDVEDLLDGYRFCWRTKWQRLRLDPQVTPYRIWRITVPERAP